MNNAQEQKAAIQDNNKARIYEARIYAAKKKKEYVKLELLHSQLDELINGNTLTTDELKILQSFVEDMREKHFTKKGILKHGKL